MNQALRSKWLTEGRVSQKKADEKPVWIKAWVKRHLLIKEQEKVRRSGARGKNEESLTV